MAAVPRSSAERSGRGFTSSSDFIDSGFADEEVMEIDEFGEMHRVRERMKAVSGDFKKKEYLR
jgi:hypothetical protein